jgi:hypothetical protein
MRRFLACLLLIPMLAACTVSTPQATDLAPALPYRTVTPSETPTLFPPVANIIFPTLTTFSYTVIQGDTLNSIAKRYGVTLDALLAANPGIQATALSVGTALIIPTSEETTTEPTPTPALLPVQAAHCWPQSDGGWWCFALVHNEYTETLENLSALFTLMDGSGQEIASQMAFGLLNILPSGQSMPLAVYFAPSISAFVSVRVQVLTAIRLLPGDVRYLPVMPEDTLINLDASGRTAQVAGQVILTGSGTAKTLWVLATAYDASGQVIGVRRWEASSTLTEDTPLPFDFYVSSVGPQIDRIEFLVEARP